MEIKQYIEIVRHWLWLLLLGLVLGAAVAYGLSIRQQRVYQASTRVQVMSAPQAGASDYTYWNDTQLAGTYVQTLTTRPILDEVGRQLGFTVTAAISTKVVANTQLIDIVVEDTDPQRAADVANKLVAVFAEKNNEMQANRFLESEQSLQSQIDQVDAQIQTLQTQSTEASSAETQVMVDKARSEISRLEGEILALQGEIDALATPAAAANRLTPVPTLSQYEKSLLNEKELRLKSLQNTYDMYQEIYNNLTVLGVASTAGNSSSASDQLQSTLALYGQIRANLLGSYEQVRLSRLNSTSNIVQIEPAVANNSPIRPQIPQTTALGGAVGLLLAGAFVFLKEYLDDTLKTPGQITRLLGLPVIGYIAEMQHNKDLPYVSESPRSPVSEAFRTLRTNLEFASVDNPLKSLVVVSAHPSEGKSTIAANLAVTMAQGGKHVLLIDADLRRPRIHQFFGMPNRAGLSDFFRDSTPLIDLTQRWKDSNLAVITSGSLPPNPADLLSSKKMASVLEAGTNAADIVIVEAPPVLVADASILASRVDGILLVVHPGKTPADGAVSTLEQLSRAGAHVVGVVMNRIPRNRSYYYGGARYYSRYYQHHYDSTFEEEKKNGNHGHLGGLKERLFGNNRKLKEEVETPPEISNN
jgi:succinoglycan biosynthesis transport protein ExoP